MTEQGRQLVEATRRVRLALEGAASALTAADLDALLRSEAQLELAVRMPVQPLQLAPDDRRRLRDELSAVRRALRRCRRLGAALGDVVNATLDAHGRTAGYRRPGMLPATYQRHSLDRTG